MFGDIFHFDIEFVNLCSIYEKILAGKIEWPRHVDAVAKDLIKKLLVPDRTKRLGNMKNGAEDVRRHRLDMVFPWSVRWSVGRGWFVIFWWCNISNELMTTNHPKQEIFFSPHVPVILCPPVCFDDVRF